MSPLVFPPAPNPEVSIVVPTIRNPGRLRTCLGSLLEHIPESISYEVLVVLDGAEPDLVAFVAEEVLGAEVLAWDERRGLPAGLNAACRRARSDRLVVLQDDAVALSGWLPALLRSAERYPQAGLIGSLVLGTDGSTLWAGAVILADGTTCPPWVGDPPPPGSLTNVRPADYAAGTSYLFQRSAWAATGGFDEGLYPAIYVDADFSCALWASGRSVLVDPRSVVVHEVHGSFERPFQLFIHARNRDRFCQRWQHLLAGRPVHPLTEESLAAIDSRLSQWLSSPPEGVGPTDRPSHTTPQSPAAYAERERTTLRDYIRHLERKLAGQTV
jgi:GT2 family glycosyltransferase